MISDQIIQKGLPSDTKDMLSWAVYTFCVREAIKKKNCVFYDIVIIRETTYPPSLIMT